MNPLDPFKGNWLKFEASDKKWHEKMKHKALGLSAEAVGKVSLSPVYFKGKSQADILSTTC